MRSHNICVQRKLSLHYPCYPFLSGALIYYIHIYSRKDGSVITDIFGLEAETTLRCRCGQETKRHNETTLVNLIYPDCSGQG